MYIRGMGSGNKGMSLVEVLVTMVVLLIGILTIVQMFPAGFGVVRSAESMTIATKLAQSELEHWKNLSANLPAGILPIDCNGNVINTQFPGPPFETFVEDPGGEFSITGPDGEMHTYSRGNVLNIRQIIGETTQIPVRSYFQTAVGSKYGGRYTLAFGPIDVVYDEATHHLVSGLAIKSGDLRRRGGDKDLYPPYLRLGDYAVDYGAEGTPEFYVAFPRGPSAADRTYYISYSYWAVNSGGELELLSELDQPVPVPAGTGDWITVPVTPPPDYTFHEVESGSDTCARAFTEVSGQWSTTDPYQFALADHILGVIAFNPIGRGMFEYTAQGIRPIEARIDYRIYDPRIIREDKTIPPPDPNATHIPIKMALRFILNIDDPTDNPPEPNYRGIAPAIGLTEPVRLIDLSTGARVEPIDDAPANQIEIDYKAGMVRVPLRANLRWWDQENNDWVTSPTELAGKRLRFLYRAEGDWAIQCQKAYAAYTRETRTGAVDYRHYRLGGAGIPSRLYFAKSEAEKTVSVDYTYSYADGVEHKVVGESQRISDASDNILDLHYIDLRVPPGATLRRVYAVVGTSFRVRVIWRESRAWRHVDLDTNLVRGQ